MDITLLTAALLFFSGALSYRVLAGFLGLLRGAYILDTTIKMSYDILFRVDESVITSNSFKYDCLVSSGACTESELEKLKKLDEHTLQTWRQESIERLRSCMPGNLDKTYGCTSWREAKKFVGCPINPRRNNET